MALRDEGEIQAKVVAVAGWLTVPPEPDCGRDVAVESDGPYGVGANCRRSTVLTDDAEPVFAIRGGEGRRLRDPVADAELHPQALPGVSLAGIAADQIALDLVIRPERAVVLGQYADPRLSECQSSSSGCGSTFAIERVVWVEGSWRLRRPELYPADVDPVPSGMVRWPIVDRAIRRGAIVLTEVIVERDHLAAIDPTADAVVPRDVDTIWYVRALMRPRRPAGGQSETEVRVVVGGAHAGERGEAHHCLVIPPCVVLRACERLEDAARVRLGSRSAGEQRRRGGGMSLARSCRPRWYHS